jgi:hypothetical protein
MPPNNTHAFFIRFIHPFHSSVSFIRFILSTIMPLPQSFTVGLLQFAVSADLEKNVSDTVLRVEEAADKGAQVLCLPELLPTRRF